MLWNTSKINGYVIKADDGTLGTVDDLLFDDLSWSIRWLVVDTGHWLSGRKVLLPVFALGHLDAEREQFSVHLTKKQVEESPDIDTHQPVSRQMETNIFDYYGWSPYWGSGYYMGGYGAMAAAPMVEPRLREDEIRDSENRRGDPHLRSVEQVTGYHIDAHDGEIGHIADFLIGDSDWSIHYLVVDTRNWWPGKQVLVSPRSITAIDWSKRLVDLNVARRSVKDSPGYDASIVVDREYENHFNNYYKDQIPVELA